MARAPKIKKKKWNLILYISIIYTGPIASPIHPPNPPLPFD
jgi:hypothetical protein